MPDYFFLPFSYKLSMNVPMSIYLKLLLLLPLPKEFVFVCFYWLITCFIDKLGLLLAC